MKIRFSFEWLLSRAQRYKGQGRFYYKTCEKLPPTSSYSTKPPEIPFTNPNRPQSQGDVNLGRSDFPLQFHVMANTDGNHGRIYHGNNPSVTTILDATRPKNELYALLNWRRGLIKELGQGGYNDRVANIKNQGTTFHLAIKEYFLNGSRPTLHESNLGHWESVQHVLSNIDLVVALESVVIHPKLQYAGMLDAIISYQDKLCVIDWKTSQKRRTELKECFSYPHQIVAYAGAVNSDPKYDPIQINHGLLVLAYQDGSPADAIWLTPDFCKYYWTEWLHRLQLYNQIMSTSFHPNEGTRIRDLAQSVNGIPGRRPILLQDKEQSSMEHVEINKTSADIAKWSQTIVDIFETDPSTCEFHEENY